MPDLGVELTKPYKDLDPNLKEILGRPNFTLAGIAAALREAGEEIPKKAEHEQAAAIQFMLAMWEHHGDSWAEEGNKVIDEMRDKARGVE